MGDDVKIIKTEVNNSKETQKGSLGQAIKEDYQLSILNFRFQFVVSNANINMC